MKYRFLVIILLIIFNLTPVLAQSTYKTVSLATSDDAAISDPVGNSTQASFYGINTSSLNYSIRVDALCAWVGWPYTLETWEEVSRDRNVSWIETQSRNSSFKIRLWSLGSKGAKGNGSVTLK